MKAIFNLIFSFFFFTALGQIPFTNPFKDYKEPESKVLSFSYQRMIEKVNDTLYIEKYFNASTKKIMTFTSFKSIKEPVLNGYYYNQWDDGEKFAEGLYINNLKEGEWIENERKGSYINNQKEGKWININETDSIQTVENYIEGKLDGEVLRYKNGHLDGKQIYKQGVLMEGDSLFEMVHSMPYLKEFGIYTDKDEREKCSQTQLLSSLYKNIKYPKKIRDKGIEGQVVVQFIVSKEGEMIDFKVKRGICHELENEVIASFYKLPYWIPGTQDDKKKIKRLGFGFQLSLT